MMWVRQQLAQARLTEMAKYLTQDQVRKRVPLLRTSAVGPTVKDRSWRIMTEAASHAAASMAAETPTCASEAAQ